jgi:hypothetical protein
MRSGIAILCALLAVYVLAWEASAERAKRKGAVTLYRATIGLRVLFGAGTIAMVYGAVVVARSDNFRRDWWVSVLLFGLAVFCASQWPADLGVSESGIVEKRWFGIRKRVFQWQDVASAALDPAEDSVCVVTKSGITIKHTKYHADRAGFIAQVKTYCIWL